MIPLVRSELLKLTSVRSTRALLLLALALGAAGVARVVRAAGSAGGVGPGSEDAWTQVLGAGMGSTVLVILIGVLSATAETRHGGLGPTLLVSPHRGRVVAAKVAACSLLGVGMTLAFAGGALAAGIATGVVAFPPLSELLRLLVTGCLLSAFWAWFGVAIGLLVRRQLPALVVPLVWLLVVETLVVSYGLRVVAPWLPGGAAAGLTGAEIPGLLPAWLAALVLTAYGAALTVPGLRRLRAADVT